MSWLVVPLGCTVKEEERLGTPELEGKEKNANYNLITYI
jgi:hypothetical protein